jgi:cell division protein FtsB
MNAKIIIIVGVVCFITGGIFTAGGLYLSQKDRLELNKTKITGIEADNDRLRQANIELTTDIESLRGQLAIERRNNKKLAGEIELFRNGNIRSGEIIDELQAIINGY